MEKQNKQETTNAVCAICGAEGKQLEYKGWIQVTADNNGIKKSIRKIYNGKVLCYGCLDLLE